MPPRKTRKHALTDNFTTFSRSNKGFATNDYLKENAHLLTAYEKKEVLKYSTIYYLGTQEAKDARKMKCLINSKINNGFDLEGGFYKVVEGDHLDYRFEVLKDVDKGAFG